MRTDLLAAMTKRDTTRVRALRNMLGVIGNAEAVDLEDHLTGPGIEPPSEVSRRILTEDHRQQLLVEQIAHLRRAASQLRRLQHPDRAAGLDEERAVLASYADVADRGPADSSL